MDCGIVLENLGPYLDDELSGRRFAAMQGHLKRCPTCTARAEELQRLIHRLRSLSRGPEIKAPPDLWPKIEQRLNSPSVKTVAGSRAIAFFRKPLAAAAVVALLIGAGAFWSWSPFGGAQTARADSIDYGVLLDGLGNNPESAFLRFLDHYQAESIRADAAHSAAPQLGFSLPPRLPSGHRLDKVYKLRFGTSPGIAARYVKDQQPLFVFFHPPTDREHTGKYQERPCLIGSYHGRQVEVGSWHLVHVTDRATCRCVLTTLNVESQLSPVLAAVTPDSDLG